MTDSFPSLLCHGINTKNNLILCYSQPEPQIIDFVSQQYKLFPHIATYFAFQYSGTWLWDVYNNVTSELEAGQLESLPEVSF
jgi:hypothetical protein